MTSSKHRNPGGGPSRRQKGGFPRPPDDLERNPGIGSSKGIFSRTGTNPEAIEGENTAEGDVMNDVNPQGGVDPDQQGRTNR